MELRKIIQARMTELDITVYKLAQISEVNRDNIYRWLAGRQEIGAGKLERILDALGLEVASKKTQ